MGLVFGEINPLGWILSSEQRVSELSALVDFDDTVADGRLTGFEGERSLTQTSTRVFAESRTVFAVYLEL
jgi:hypothetical protein